VLSDSKVRMVAGGVVVAVIVGGVLVWRWINKVAPSFNP